MRSGLVEQDLGRDRIVTLVFDYRVELSGRLRGFEGIVERELGRE